jgi:hypothetical protein
MPTAIADSNSTNTTPSMRHQAAFKESFIYE